MSRLEDLGVIDPTYLLGHNNSNVSGRISVDTLLGKITHTNYAATYSAATSALSTYKENDYIQIFADETKSGVSSIYKIVNGLLVFQTVLSNGGGSYLYPMSLGTYRMWISSTGKLYLKNGVPTSDTDGTVVGTQT